MSIYPAVQLQQYYSFKLADNIHILFEDFSLVDGDSLYKAIQTKTYDNVCVVKDKMYINTINDMISVVGTIISDGTYMISHGPYGKTQHIPYTCSKQTVIDGIQLLYHMYNSWVNEKPC